MKREIFTAYNDKTHAFVESGRLKTVSYGSFQAIGIRVIENSRQGFVSAIGSTDIDKLTPMAREIAKTSPEDPFLDIGRPGRYPDITGIYDETIDKIDMVKTAAELAKKFLELAKETDSRISVDSLMVDIEKTEVSVENTEGVSVSEKRTTFSMGIAGMAIEGDEVSSFDYISVEDVNYERFIDRVESELRTFVKRLVKTLNPRKAPSYKGLILLSPRAVEDILIDFITYHASGLRVVRNASMWKNSIGKQIASPKLSIIDNPLVDGSPYATAFDREGTPTSLTPIISKGTLESFFLNAYASKYLGMVNTGHASGGYSSVPGVAPHCLKIDSTSSLDDMIKSIDRAILLERFSGNINYQTGMVSGVAKNSFFIENGEIAYGITDTMVSFSVLDILNGIVDISKDIQMLNTGPMPYILAEGAEIIGG